MPSAAYAGLLADPQRLRQALAQALITTGRQRTIAELGTRYGGRGLTGPPDE